MTDKPLLINYQEDPDNLTGFRPVASAIKIEDRTFAELLYECMTKDQIKECLDLHDAIKASANKA
jgi:hypothetical protein